MGGEVGGGGEGDVDAVGAGENGHKGARRLPCKRRGGWGHLQNVQTNGSTLVLDRRRE